MEIYRKSVRESKKIRMNKVRIWNHYISWPLCRARSYSFASRLFALNRLSGSGRERVRCRWAHWIRIRWGIKWLTTDSFACFTYFLVFYFCAFEDGKHGVHTICFVCFVPYVSFVFSHFSLFSPKMYGVRSTLLFDIPCKYWNWLNTLQNDKRTKK